MTQNQHFNRRAGVSGNKPQMSVFTLLNLLKRKLS